MEAYIPIQTLNTFPRIHMRNLKTPKRKKSKTSLKLVPKLVETLRLILTRPYTAAILAILGIIIAGATLYLNSFHKTRSVHFSGSDKNASMTSGQFNVALLFSNTGNTPVTINRIYSEIVLATNPDYLWANAHTSVKSLPDGTTKWQQLLINPVTITPGAIYSDNVVICKPYPFFIQSELQISVRIDFVDYLGNKFRATLPLEDVRWNSLTAGPDHKVIGYVNAVFPVDLRETDLFEKGSEIGPESFISADYQKPDCLNGQNADKDQTP